MSRKLIATPNDCLNLTHNSYLNLHKDSRVIQGGINYVSKFGTSMTTSPLIGNAQIYDEIVEVIGNIYFKKRALIFPSGFQCNIGAIPAILSYYEDAVILSDKLNHNSIWQGIFASKRQFFSYNNCNLEELENLLIRFAGKKHIVITESIFSMDGTAVDVQRFMELKHKYGFVAYVDEAHALGVFGKTGYGLFEEHDIDIRMGTFSKALGGQGGFLVVDDNLYNYLVNKANGLIYSTGLNPFSVGAAKSAFEVLPSCTQARESIFKQIQIVNQCLKADYVSHIIPIIFTNEIDAIKMRDKCYERKVLTSFIKHPTVDKKSPRIRICIHSEVNLSDYQWNTFLL